jgi:predicted RNA-binding Zn ribbon-like protein
MVFFILERYSNQVAKRRQALADLDDALVRFLNGEGDGPELLRRLADTVARGRMLGKADLAELNRLLAHTPVEVRLADGGEGRYVLEMRPLADDPVAAAERELAGSFASLLRRAPDRLKRCDECRDFYLDSTRSRTQRWCTPRCGDRARVREHRARRGR